MNYKFSKEYNPSPSKCSKPYRTKRFIASIVCLFFTLILIFLFVDSFIDLKHEVKNESITSAAIASLFLVIIGIFLLCTALTSSFFGFCLGYTSVNYLPTKKLTVWAKVVTYSNLVIAILSAIPALYFIWLLFTN